MGGWMWGGADEQDAHATIEGALDSGVDVIDTAPVYGFGFSETLVGDVLAKRGTRGEVVIATKLGLSWDDVHETHRDSSPKRIREEVHASLRRLRTDYIDLYQVHWPDPAVPLEDTSAALTALRDEGLVRAIGVCNYSDEQMGTFARGGRLDASQFRYNVFERMPEQDVLPYCREAGLTTLAYSPLARGLLTGAMTADREPTDEARRGEMFHGESYRQHLSVVARLDEFAQREFGRRVIHLAIRWLLDQPGLTIALWGARKPSQLAAMSGVEGFSLDEDAMSAIDEIIEAGLAGAPSARGR